jgi:hypothetical protein
VFLLGMYTHGSNQQQQQQQQQLNETQLEILGT